MTDPQPPVTLIPEPDVVRARLAKVHAEARLLKQLLRLSLRAELAKPADRPAERKGVQHAR